MRLLHGAVDLIVIDPELPALTDGVYLLRRIRQRFSNIPAIVISASLTSLEEASGITRALDVAELITKPLDAAVLSTAVTGALAAS
jgi:CheY-like chemotaxis protein